jgi:signal transduction histidine kinase
LERVFTNLIKNGIEAAGDHSLGYRRVEISICNTESTVSVHIEDTGPGFPASQQVFRPLRTTKIHGHGLGLFVSRKIVQAHQGALEVGTSARLGGARVSVTLFPRNGVIQVGLERIFLP